MWLFNNDMRQKEIYGNDNAARTSTPNYESHIINISPVFHLHYSPQYMQVSLNRPAAERFSFN